MTQNNHIHPLDTPVGDIPTWWKIISIMSFFGLPFFVGPWLLVGMNWLFETVVFPYWGWVLALGN